MKAKDDEKSEVKGVRITDEALIDMFKKALKYNDNVDAQNLGTMPTPIARMGIDDKGEPIVLERYDE